MFELKTGCISKRYINLYYYKNIIIIIITNARLLVTTVSRQSIAGYRQVL